MFDNICTLPVRSDVFATAIHPTEPLVTVGLTSGHVETYRLPSRDASSNNEGDAECDNSVLSDGKGLIDAVWKTRRHKGSCRCLAYSHDGRAMYSAGTDELVKHFDPGSGEVITKILIPRKENVADAPTILHVLNPQNLILATDSGALHIVDLRDGAPGKKPSQTHFPHSDYISSLTPLPPSENSTSGFPKQWVSTGGSTLAVTDVRGGVLQRSEDQEDELLSSCYMSGVARKNNGTDGIVAVGTATGVMTIWNSGFWEDQQHRIIVDGGSGGGESIDAMVRMPPEMDAEAKLVCGAGDGRLQIVDLARKEVERWHNLRHDDFEAVVSLGFDSQNRLISAGGRTVKVWQEFAALPDSENDDDEEEEEEADVHSGNKSKRRATTDSNDGDDDDDGDGDDDDDDDDDDDNITEATIKEEMPQRAKRRKTSRKDKLGPMGAHGIMGFKGLD